MIDLDMPPRAGAIRRPVARADVLMENFGRPPPPRTSRPRGGQRPSSTPGARRPRRPGTRGAAFGLASRASARLCFFTARSGIGFPDRPPCWLPGFQAHDCASVVGVVGALAAAQRPRARRSRATVEVSVQEATMVSLAPWAILLADYARRFPLAPAFLPRDADGADLVLPVADGCVLVLAVTPRQLRALSPRSDRARPSPRRAAPMRAALRSSWARGARASTRCAGQGMTRIVNGSTSRASRRRGSPCFRCSRAWPAAQTALTRLRFRRSPAPCAGMRRDDMVATGPARPADRTRPSPRGVRRCGADARARLLPPHRLSAPGRRPGRAVSLQPVGDARWAEPAGAGARR